MRFNLTSRRIRPQHRHRYHASPLLEKVLAYPTSLSRPVYIDGQEPSGWWSQAGHADEEMDGGYGNND
ncbi:hypothetical protein [Nonomuraea insulae]|uniref:Uncharacterized protein n=1 Tax=Nonomuraea insulae TaxID=1616787 RepID=A0ABW1DCC9_9ACTN